MEKFAERYGYITEKGVQFEKKDIGTRTRLSNLVFEILNDIQKENDLYPMLEFISDEYFKQSKNKNIDFYFNLISEVINSKIWYETFSFIEYFVDIMRHIDLNSYNELIKRLDRIFTQEKCGYRIVENLIIPITNETELQLLREIVTSKFDAVNIHLKKALGFYANRETPDYSNSIKESISAVESICCIIVGKDNAVLSSALDRLVQKGVLIHQSQIKAFKMLYGYTSDENGIRHAGIDFKNSSPEDAQYMLISCSSFVHYLIQKYEKINNVS